MAMYHLFGAQILITVHCNKQRVPFLRVDPHCWEVYSYMATQSSSWDNLPRF